MSFVGYNLSDLNYYLDVTPYNTLANTHNNSCLIIDLHLFIVHNLIFYLNGYLLCIT
jgi:hypothetical protein